MDRTDLLLVDLFAGCGGMGLGFHQAGFSTFLANELHPDPAKTYAENLLKDHKERMMVGSISKELSETKLSKLNLPENGIARSLHTTRQNQNQEVKRCRPDHSHVEMN